MFESTQLYHLCRSMTVRRAAHVLRNRMQALVPSALEVQSMILRLALAIALLAWPALAWAHDHGHSHQGGQEIKIASYQVELVVKGSDVALFVNDAQDRKIDASGFTATAVVLAKGNQQKTVELTPAGNNKLAGKIDFAFEGKFRATVTLKNASGELGKGRYNLDVPH